VRERDRPVEEILDHGFALARDLEAQRAPGQAALAAATGVPEGLPPPLRRLALRLELLGRALAVIGMPARQQALGMGVVDVQTLGLPVAPGRRALVPVEPEPAHRVQDRLDRLVRRPGAIGVLDPEHEHAAMVAREEPVEERRTGAADVEMTGRARREANADGVGHRQYVPNS